MSKEHQKKFTKKPRRTAILFLFSFLFGERERESEELDDI